MLSRVSTKKRLSRSPCTRSGFVDILNDWKLSMPGMGVWGGNENSIPDIWLESLDIIMILFPIVYVKSLLAFYFTSYEFHRLYNISWLFSYLYLFLKKITSSMAFSLFPFPFRIFNSINNCFFKTFFTYFPVVYAIVTRFWIVYRFIITITHTNTLPHIRSLLISHPENF